MDAKNRPSKLENYRQKRSHSGNERRESIIQSAEELFLTEGLISTTMVQIAKSAGINKVTLYRHYPDKDPLARMVAQRMLDRISMVVARNTERGVAGLLAFRQGLLVMIREFPELQDAYRYLAEFDLLYSERYDSEEWRPVLRHRLFQIFGHEQFGLAVLRNDENIMVRLATLVNSVSGFLEKAAIRSSVLIDKDELALQAQLHHFETMALGFFDQLIDRR